ncbi:hypothetical protein M440DRAFT_1310598, partial [Trichoderma longibrachiatum ATCC 18648]
LSYTSNSVTQIKKKTYSLLFSPLRPVSAQRISNISFAKSVAQRWQDPKKRLIPWRLLRIYHHVESRSKVGKEKKR